MNTEDLTILLRDTRDTLADLALISTNSTQQHALRVSVGRILVALREQMDDLDYEYTLFVCEVHPIVVDHYKRLYFASIRERLEVEA